MRIELNTRCIDSNCKAEIWTENRGFYILDVRGLYLGNKVGASDKTLWSLIWKISVLCLTGYNSGVNNTGDLETRHGDMGLIAWDVLLPSGAIIPRYFKHHDPQWFYLHISIQIVGFLPGLATVVAGRTLYNGLESYRIPKFKIHRPLGSLVFFLGILQVCFHSPWAFTRH